MGLATQERSCCIASWGMTLRFGAFAVRQARRAHKKSMRCALLVCPAPLRSVVAKVVSELATQNSMMGHAALGDVEGSGIAAGAWLMCCNCTPGLFSGWGPVQHRLLGNQEAW